MKLVDIVSFRRTGTHLLAKLLHSNAETGAESYTELHFSHSKLSPRPYVATLRAVYPTMVSMWRMRDRFLVPRSVSFSDFVRRPFDSLVGDVAPRVVLDGVPVPDGERGPFSCATSLAEKWAVDTIRFAEGAAVVVPYTLMVDDPLCAVGCVCTALSLKRRSGFTPVLHRVGYWSLDEEDPVVTLSDFRYLQEFQEHVDSRLAG